MRKIQFLGILLLAISTLAFAGGNNEQSATNEFVIDIDRFESLMDSTQLTILDVRDNTSYLKGHIPGAFLLPLREVEKQGGEFINMGNPIVTYCSCPAEESSMSAAIKLRELGATTVYVLLGGYNKWVRDRKPIISGSNPS